MISENNQITYGTPLPEKEDDQLTLNPTALYHQKVTDSEGRQRFHGAFTGGFSAGYFNTVGSKGGWVPSSFQSSHKRKAEIREHVPENFMDEEDLGNFGIAPRQVRTAKEYSHRSDWLLSHLTTLCHADQALGVKLLKSLGWRAGKGVGAKIKRQVDFGQSDVYGCQPREELVLHDFDPCDVPSIDFVVKDNQFGLGYHGMVGLDCFGGAGRGGVKARLGYNQEDYLSCRGEAFGVGVFEGADDDIYSREDMDKYDLDIGEDEPTDRVHGWTAPIKTERYAGVIEGFVVAAEVVTPVIAAPSIVPPKDYRPPKMSRFDDVTPLSAGRVNKSRFSLNPVTRGDILDDGTDTFKFVKFGASRLLTDMSKAEGGANKAEEVVPAIVWRDARRTVTQWVPDNLVCKRFNVPNPFPDLAASDAKVLGKHKIFTDLVPPNKIEKKRERVADPKAVNIFSHLFVDADKTGVISIPDEEYKIVKEPYVNDLDNRPMDLFNEIFGNSGDEDVSPILSPVKVKTEPLDDYPNEVVTDDAFCTELKPVKCENEESDDSSNSYFGPPMPYSR